jgi:glutamyl-Q tRNA(Asp) synthetase
VAAEFVTRFAPSPTGRLHRGHAFSALTAQAAAKAGEGRLLLRLEDIDTARCRPEFEGGILEDLRWLGVAWNGPVRRQSEHMEDYAAALERLRREGLVYRCFRTRREVMEDIGRAPHDDGRAPPFRGASLPAVEEDALIKAGRPFAWRLSLQAAQARLADRFKALSFVEDGLGPDGEHGVMAADPTREGDIILARKDLGVAYHLAVVVDDARQGVSHVIRGNDLFGAAHVQRLLQALLGLPTPVYRHHSLLLRSDGKRFAKRDTMETLQDLRARGVTADDLRSELGFR